MPTTLFQPNFRLSSPLSQDWHSEQYNQCLLQGIIEWCKWSLLDIGGYQNVRRTDVSGIYGGHMARLRPVQDPNYTDGQVWEAIRSDWVWEKGVTYSGTAPSVASGVSVNDTFYPTASTTSTYQHLINFPLGRIVFNQAINLSSIVTTDYCYRAVSFVKSKEPWFTQLLYKSFNIQRSDFLTATGAFNVLAQARRQMPAVGIELVQRRSSQPYELGSLTQNVNQDMLFYIVAESDIERDQLVDILTGQIDKSIWLPDIAKMKSDARYPMTLDYNGSPVASPMYYPSLINEFPGVKVRIENTSAQSMETINSWLYRGVVRITFGAII